MKEKKINSAIPLAEKMRPEKIDEFAGQEHLLADGKLLKKLITNDNITSMILWGPPGSGKTTLAKIIAKYTKKNFVAFSAILQGVKELKSIVEEAKKIHQNLQQATILFVDEIHRFNKAQQDAFLPQVESGAIILIGATTENPSFEVNSALLSRCRTYILKPLTDENIQSIIIKAIKDEEKGLGKYKAIICKKELEILANYANGDARTALNILEIAVLTAKENDGQQRIITKEVLQEAISQRNISYDKKGEEFYNLISALHKSIRGSDPQAAVYWLARMLMAGAEPLYIARRLVVVASEDVGLADPQALQLAIAAKEAIHFLGLPEAELALTQATIYLATAPKSNSVINTLYKVKEQIKNKNNPPVPLHLRNAPTKLMEDVGYKKNYKYDHDYPDNYAGQEFLPEPHNQDQYYKPGKFGFEKEIAKRISYWKELKKIRTAKKE